MKPRIVFLLAIVLNMSMGSLAQQVYRGNVCQNIPNLSTEQKQNIDKLGVTHQQKMDRLRDQFYAERDVASASAIKTQMNAEVTNHNKNISALLTPEQKVFLDQNCYANRSKGPNSRRGFGRNGRAYRQGGQGYGQGNGSALGQGNRSALGQGRGRGQGRGYGRW